MKKAISLNLVFLLLISMMCALLISCTPKAQTLKDVIGTYYLWKDNRLFKDSYMKLNSDGTGLLSNEDEVITFKFALNPDSQGHTFRPVDTSEINDGSLPYVCGIRDNIINFCISTIQGVSEEFFYCKEDVKSPFKEYGTIYYSVCSDGYYQVTGYVKSVDIITIPYYIDNSTRLTTIGFNAFAGFSELETIVYYGSREQWNKITKRKGWNNDTGNYIIQCTNGIISKQSS